MAVTLCERCFPDWCNYEIYSMVPITECAQCGNHENLWSGSPDVVKRHLFPRDPRDPCVTRIEPAEERLR
jgi:hypothetical protein